MVLLEQKILDHYEDNTKLLLKIFLVYDNIT
jgi:hypothetical protein